MARAWFPQLQSHHVLYFVLELLVRYFQNRNYRFAVKLNPSECSFFHFAPAVILASVKHLLVFPFLRHLEFRKHQGFNTHQHSPPRFLLDGVTTQQEHR